MRILINVIFLFVSSLSFGGGGFFSDELYFDVFNQLSIVDEKFAPFILTPQADIAFDYESFFKPQSESRNFEFWMDYFDNKIKKDDLAHLIFYAQPREKENFIIEYPFLNLEKYADFWDYIFLTRKCDQAIMPTYDDIWEGNFKVKNKDSLFVEIEQKANQSLEPLKKRYAYQLMKLANADKDYKEVDQIFNTYFKKEKGEVIDFLAMDKQARALAFQFGEYEKAGSFYLKVFLNLPSKVRSAYQSLKYVLKPEQMLDMESFLKTQEEKSALIFLSDFRQRKTPIHTLKKLVEIDPNSEFSYLSLSRSLNAINRKQFPNYYEHQAPIRCDEYVVANEASTSYRNYLFGEIDFITETNERLEELDETIDEVLRSTLKDKSIWYYARAQLSLFDGEYQKGLESLNQVQTTNKRFKDQVDLLKSFLTVASFNKIDSKQEKLLLDLIPLNEYSIDQVQTGYEVEDNKKLVWRLLAKKYYDQGDYAKAFLCLNDIHSLYHSRDICVLNDLLNFSKKANKNEFEKILISRLKHDYPELALLDQIANYHISEFENKKALDIYKVIENSSEAEKKSIKGYYEINYRVFETYIDNCYYCETSSIESIPIPFVDIPQLQNKYEVLEFLNELQKSDDPSSTYLLANFYLNISKYKHFRFFFTGEKWSVHRIFYTDRSTIDDYVDIPISNERIATMFTKVINDDSSNIELKAASVWGLAEIDFNQKYIDWVFSDQSEGEAFKRKRMDVMKPAYIAFSEYEKTLFYQEIINECSYYSDYSRKKKF